MFLDRKEAGRQLAKRLQAYKTTDAVVLAIPRGGVPVAIALAARLNLWVDLVVPRKLPVPWNPEAGFGAVASDGSVVLNEPMIRELGLTQSGIRSIAEAVQAEVIRREELYHTALPKLDIAGKNVIIVDDGLASGYTMLAAVRSARKAGAKRVTVAVPVSSQSAARLIVDSADEFICLVESHELPFAVANFYVNWHDLTDQDVLDCIAETEPLRSGSSR